MDQPNEFDEKREGTVAAVFLISAIVATVGIVASDLRILAFVGAPIAIAALVISRTKLAIAVAACGLAAVRFLFALAVTGDLRMLAGLVVSGGAALLLLRVAADQESAHESVTAKVQRNRTIEK